MCIRDSKKGHYDKIVSNVQEIKARKGKVIAVVNYGDEQVASMADYVIEIPDTSECFSPIVASMPLQLLSYYSAVYRGANAVSYTHLDVYKRQLEFMIFAGHSVAIKLWQVQAYKLLVKALVINPNSLLKFMPD